MCDEAALSAACGTEMGGFCNGAAQRAALARCYARVNRRANQAVN